MSFTAFVVAVLVVWRGTHLLQAEDGPWNLVTRLRRLAGRSVFGELLDCFYCLSLWLAAPVAFVAAERWKERLLLWPALSGGAILLERVTTRPEALAVAPHQGVESDVVLREQSSAAAGDVETGKQL